MVKEIKEIVNIKLSIFKDIRYLLNLKTCVRRILKRNLN